VENSLHDRTVASGEKWFDEGRGQEGRLRARIQCPWHALCAFLANSLLRLFGIIRPERVWRINKKKWGYKAEELKRS